jgi:3D (Asp-Asp-Asp) domain-containing protein
MVLTTFLVTKGYAMKKPMQLVITTIISTLVLSNILISHKMLQKSNENEQILNHLARNKAEFNTFVRKNGHKIDVLSDVISEQKKQLKSKQNEIHKLEKQLENAKKRNESPTISISRGESANQKAYFEVTAYTAGVESTGKSPSHPSYGLTASGTKVKEGRTIACPPSYPFGTKMKIDTVGFRVCEDRGGAIKTGHLDLYVESLNEAIEFGRQTLLVEILK